MFLPKFIRSFALWTILIRVIGYNISTSTTDILPLANRLATSAVNICHIASTTTCENAIQMILTSTGACLTSKLPKAAHILKNRRIYCAKLRSAFAEMLRVLYWIVAPRVMSH
ncbi:hypothetical protein BDV35DRAFT_333474 [Aspergillus flavus]|uniref:Uncharacterized protein n=1 Tax=Aspergillus flavus TaxID=5059 RepID=A0A5N6HFL3_ASPFL|nr:hypothetical protein BDV35DRAFT_333474 [Aspergillus flavus]